MGVTSALSKGKSKIDGPGGIMFEQYLRQSGMFGDLNLLLDVRSCRLWPVHTIDVKI